MKRAFRKIKTFRCMLWAALSLFLLALLLCSRQRRLPECNLGLNTPKTVCLNLAKSQERRRVQSSQLSTVAGQNGRHVMVNGSSDAFELLEATPEHVRIRFTSGGLSIEEIQVDGKPYSSIHMAGSWPGNVKGKPQLPVYGIRLAVPASISPIVTVNEAEWTTVSCPPPVPASGHLKRSVHKQTLEEDPMVYNGMESWPCEMVSVSASRQIRQTASRKIMVSPVQYDFKRGVLNICKSCVLDVRMDGAVAEDYAVLDSQGDFAQIQSRGILNSVLLSPSAGESPDTIGRVLYLLPDDWKGPEIEDYTAWKEKLGFEVRTLGYPSETGMGAEALLKTVRRLYSEWGLTHLVLIGRVEQIPSAIMAESVNKRDKPTTYDSTFPSDLTVSDVPYALLAGDDICQDVFLSRIPVSERTEMAVVLDKLARYEKAAFDSSAEDSWRQRGLFIGGTLSAADYYHESQIPPEFRGKDDGNVVEEERLRLIEQAKFAPGSYGFYRTAVSAPLVSSAIDTGVSLVNYMGHGLNDGWVTGQYYVTHAKSQTNGEMLPFVSSCVCLTGNFGCSPQASSYIYNAVHYTQDGNCLAEGLLKNPSGGACGVLAATNDVSIIPPYYIMSGLDDAVGNADTEKRLICHGAYALNAILSGIEYSETTTYACGGIGDELAKQFHLIGDCTLSGRFRCLQDMTIAVNVSSGMVVSVTSGTDKKHLPGSYVCGKSTVNGRMLSARTDFQGRAVLPFTNQELMGGISLSVYDPLHGFQEKSFNAIDTDGDGLISNQEILQYLSIVDDDERRAEAILLWQNSPAMASHDENADSQRVNQNAQGDWLVHENPDAMNNFNDACGMEKLNERPFDCRSNPHGMDTSVLSSLSRGEAGYWGYDELMKRLENSWMTHWDVCRPVFIGESVERRTILGLRIASQKAMDSCCPELLITGGIHGNERPGVEVSMRFGQWLLEHRNDGNAEGRRIQQLLDNVILYVIPCMNPDGMEMARTAQTDRMQWENARGNAHGIDLNRSYPDGVINSIIGRYGNGDNLCLDESLPSEVSGMGWKASLVPETVSFMKWCCRRRISAALLLHTGAFCICYPYGNNASGRAVNTPCPDVETLSELAQHYADILSLPEKKMTVKNAAEWYPVSGEATDWMYRFLGILPLTVEISESKEPDLSMRDAIFMEQRPAMLGWMEKCINGIGGQIHDEKGAGVPYAEITVGKGAPFHADADGHFFRPAFYSEATQLSVSAPGLQPSVIEADMNVHLDVGMNSLEETSLYILPKVLRKRYVPGHDETVQVTLMDRRSAPLEYILSIKPSGSACTKVIGGGIARMEADGDLSVLFAERSKKEETLNVTIVHSDDGFADHSIRMQAETVSGIDEKTLPWISAAARTVDSVDEKRIAYSLPVYRKCPLLTEHGFVWSGNAFCLMQSETPLTGMILCDRESTTVSGTGWEVDEPTWTLSKGWNLIGVPWKMPGNVFQSVFCWGNSSMEKADVLEPGKAYWVYSPHHQIIQ